MDHPAIVLSHGPVAGSLFRDAVDVALPLRPYAGWVPPGLDPPGGGGPGGWEAGLEERAAAWAVEALGGEEGAMLCRAYLAQVIQRDT